MITPEYLNDVIQGTELAVNRLNNQLLVEVIKKIVQAFYEGKDILMPSTIHKLHLIVQSGYSLDEIQQMIERALPNISTEIHKAFLESANTIASYNHEFSKLMIQEYSINTDMPEYTFENIPRSAKDLHMTRMEIIKLENAYKRTRGTVKNITQSTAYSVQNAYIQACDDIYMKSQAGMPAQQAVNEVVGGLAKQGITTVQYPGGHTDKIDVAIARAVRTGINQANSEIILTRCAEMGIQYVKVSQHLGARVTKHNDYTNHSWWQGKIYSLDWTKDVLIKNMASVPLGDKEFGYLQELKEKLMKEKKYDYPDFVETCGYGEIEGIIGMNCRHTFQMWQPGINIDHNDQIDQKENEERYRHEQEQRAMERSIRLMKGERKALKQIPKNDDTDTQIALLTEKIQKAVDKYSDYCKKYGLPYYSDRLGVGVV